MGIAAIISSITLPFDVPTNFIMVCDRLSALEQTTASKTDFKVTGKHFDHISITCDLLTNTKLKVIPKHVYGHQDDVNRPLTVLEKLNCQMDALAKHIAMEHIQSKNPTSHFQPTSLGYGNITCNNSLITTKLKASLYKNILHDEMC